MILPNPESLTRVTTPIAMVDGGFDPLHHGHVAYFKAASELGLPLLCCLSPDSYISRKHPVLLPQAQRAQVIDALRYIDYTYLSAGTTCEGLELIKPKIYVKGKDWEGRLPEPEVNTCKTLGIEIVYLDTILDSSTQILKNFQQG